MVHNRWMDSGTDGRMDGKSEILDVGAPPKNNSHEIFLLLFFNSYMQFFIDFLHVLHNHFLEVHLFNLMFENI